MPPRPVPMARVRSRRSLVLPGGAARRWRTRTMVCTLWPPNECACSGRRAMARNAARRPSSATGAKHSTCASARAICATAWPTKSRASCTACPPSSPSRASFYFSSSTLPVIDHLHSHLVAQLWSNISPSHWTQTPSSFFLFLSLFVCFCLVLQ